jgi:hypothetical protein
MYEDDRPPLAYQLFDNREPFINAMTRFPDCKELIPSLRKPNVMVEQELARIQQQAKTYPRAHQELAAIRYYLHFALWECQNRWNGKHQGITNYAALLRELERWRFESQEKICFVTFNYDTMLEQAMYQVLGFQTTVLDSYVSQENYVVIKLHGSINWGREIDGISTLSADIYRQQRLVGVYNHQRLIDEAAFLQISDRYTVVGEYPMLKKDDASVFPALSIPVENKDEFSCPRAHIEALETTLPQVTKILTIGWRATEQDFRTKLQYALASKSGSPDLMIVSGDANGANETLNNLQAKSPLRFRPARPVDGGFTGLVNSIGLLEAFLRERPSAPSRVENQGD